MSKFLTGEDMEFIELEPASAFKNAVESIGENNKLVVCGSPEDRSYIEESLQASTQKTQQIIECSQDIDVGCWFESRKKAFEEELEVDIDDVSGEWVEASVPKPGFTLVYDMLTGKLHEKIVGARVRTDESWKIPAFFKYGGWNDCPNPEIHCAIWRYWQDKYGAKIVAVSNDVIEAYVEKPPTTRAEALILASEQYLYCSDIVEQGGETVPNLAASIINHNVWFFWWD